MTKRKHTPICAPEVEVRPIPGYEGLYSVSRDGRVWSHAKTMGMSRHGGRWLKAAKNKGYLVVALYADQRQRMFAVHRAVALAWIPNPENLPEVNHDDGKRGNCHVDNLVWCTHAGNVLHGYQTGLNRGCSKLSIETIRQIVAARQAGEKVAEIAGRFGISKGAACNIGRGRIGKLALREMGATS